MSNITFRVPDPSEEQEGFYSAADLEVVEVAYWKGQQAYVICFDRDPPKGDGQYRVYLHRDFWPHAAFATAGDMATKEAARQKIEFMGRQFDEWLRRRWFTKKEQQ